MNLEQNETYLEPRYDTRKSFYGKAIIIKEKDKIILQSYNSFVAYIKDNKAYVNGEYLQTTMRHIKEFLKQNGFFADTTKQILKDYGNKAGVKNEKL